MRREYFELSPSSALQQLLDGEIAMENICHVCLTDWRNIIQLIFISFTCSGKPEAFPAYLKEKEKRIRKKLDKIWRALDNTGCKGGGMALLSQYFTTIFNLKSSTSNNSWIYSLTFSISVL